MDAIQNDGQGFGGGSGSGLAGFLGGLFGHSDRPYKSAIDQYQKYGDKAANVQNPFLQAGQGAIPQFQQWLQGMQDPSGFINHLMGQYQESPFAKYQQQQGMRSGTNAASAGGLIGSTPFAQQMQQNAQNISSMDMNQWLQNVIGINSQYGAGQQNLMSGGQNSANELSNLYGNMGVGMGNLSYGQQMAKNQDRSNMFGGLFDMFKNGIFG
jgi:hypothetical protein